MSEPYTPTEARVCIDFCNAAMKRRQSDGSFMSMEEADAAFSRFLSEHDRQVAERAWDAGAEMGHRLYAEPMRVVNERNPYRVAKGEQK